MAPPIASHLFQFIFSAAPIQVKTISIREKAATAIKLAVATFAFGATGWLPDVGYFTSATGFSYSSSSTPTAQTEYVPVTPSVCGAIRR